jgi:phosphohistidine phosphatase
LKNLLIIRHAKSGWDGNVVDFDRGLSDRGKNDLRLMSERLSSRFYDPQLVYCSPAKRTKKTWNAISTRLGWKEDLVEFEDELYLASIQTLLKKCSEVDEEIDRLVLVGHNPGLTELVNVCSHARLDNLPTCGLVQIRFPFDQWEQVGLQKGELVYFDYPKRQP